MKIANNIIISTSSSIVVVVVLINEYQRRLKKISISQKINLGDIYPPQ